LDNGLKTGGCCPKGRGAEDGVISGKYPLTECDSKEYHVRTSLNVSDSDATLIIFDKEKDAGTKLTQEFAISSKKPFMLVDLSQEVEINDIRNWVKNFQIQTLNIAGPRESKSPGIYQKGYYFLKELFV